MRDDLIDIVMNIHNFNQDLMELNIKYSETIERLKIKNDELLTLYTTERELKEDYKEIINKTIKYLENELWINKKEMLEILKGEDKE